MVSQPWLRYNTPLAFAPDQFGAALPGATLSFYDSGTNTPLATYSDSDLTIPNPNPMVADARGLFGPIFLQPLPYKVVYAGPAGAPYFGAEIWTQDPVENLAPATFVGVNAIVLECTFDGDGAPLAPGLVGDGYVPIDCQITRWVLQADVAGAIALDVWVNPFVAGAPPTIANSIVAAAPPALVGIQSQTNITLVGWNTLLPANSAVRYNITSTGGVITRCTLSLICAPAD